MRWFPMLLVACSPSNATVEGIDAAPECDPRSLELRVLSLPLPSGEPAPAKIYVEVTRDAKRGLFLVDTGSATTFLAQPVGTSPTANAGTVRLACADVTLPGYPVAPLGTVDGLDVIGMLGVDRLLQGPALFDVEHRRLTLGEPFPETTSWPAARFDRVQSTILAHLRLEGRDVRLLVDTGAAYTLVLGEQGQPGDQEIVNFDSAGNPLTYYLGTGELAVGGAVRTVPVVRTPSFPYLESYVASLGGNIAGLLGVSSFPHALLIDPAGTIRIAP